MSTANKTQLDMVLNQIAKARGKFGITPTKISENTGISYSVVTRRVCDLIESGYDIIKTRRNVRGSSRPNVHYLLGGEAA